MTPPTSGEPTPAARPHDDVDRHRADGAPATASAPSPERPVVVGDGRRIPVVDDPRELRRHGIRRVAIPADRIPLRRWASELSRVTPLNAFSEDGEYAFYRNIMEEPEFPFDAVLDSEIGRCMTEGFGVLDVREELRLDDAFCVSYDAEAQSDTTCGKHVDPSDVTVNMCLEKSPDAEGSMVLFYGSETLLRSGDDAQAERDGGGAAAAPGAVPTEEDGDDSASAAAAGREETISEKDGANRREGFQFLVNQEEGYATVHWGRHPHRTTALTRGRRTNVILTYRYSDESRSDVASRTCYALTGR